MKWWLWVLLAVLVVLIILIIWFLRSRKTSPTPLTAATGDDQLFTDETPTGRIPTLTEADLDPEPDSQPAAEEAPVPATLAAGNVGTRKTAQGTSQAGTATATKTTSGNGAAATVDPGKVEAGSFPNSAKPLADGSAPSSEFMIKGNADSMLYHTKESPYFSRTKAEVWFRTPEDAEAAGFTGWNKRRTAAKVIAGPYPGSALPVAGGDAPTAAFIVKGNADSMLYHTKESPFFSVTTAEVWFKSTVDAEKAGFRAAF